MDRYSFSLHRYLSRCFGPMAMALAVACGLVTGLANAAIPDGRLAPLPSTPANQPWGSGELGATNSKETATYELNGPWSAAHHVVTGEVLLPETGATLIMPDVKVLLSIDKARRNVMDLTVGAGKQTGRTLTVVTNDIKLTWVPFSMQRSAGTLSVTVGSATVSQLVPNIDPASRPLVLSLQRGARLRGVTVSSTLLPPDMAVVPLAECSVSADIVKGPDAAMGIAPSSLPSGLATVDGVPFLIGDKAVDVRLSMAGADFVRNAKYGYYTVASGTNRPVGTVPGIGYEALHVLAYSRQIPNHVPRMTLCYGKCVAWAGPMEEEVIQVPDARTGGEAAYVQSRIPVTLSDGKAGWLYHLRIPVARGASAWFAGAMQFEFTRDKVDMHNLPDPNSFARVPAGLPSSVVVVSATAERSPVGFTYVLGEPGNVFHETQDPVLTVSLTNRLDADFKGRIYARSAGPGLSEAVSPLRSEWTVEESLALKAGESRRLPLKVMPAERRKRGWFEVEIGVERDGQPVQVYRTTYAVLAPDTRQAMADSPFGVWEFWWPHASYVQRDRQATDAATLINKGGWRWTYGGNAGGRDNGGLTSADLFERYKITYTLRGMLNSYQRGEGWWSAAEFEEKAAPGLRADAGKPKPGEDPVYKVLHESRSSTAIIRRFSEFLGGTPYAMPDKEKAQLDTQFSNVSAYCLAIKKADPSVKICLVNDYPAVGIEFMKRGFPKDAFDYFGTEGANFMREPERQPDWLCLLGLLQTWKRAKEHYGYQDKPIWTTEALYHATSPDNLSLHAQSGIQVREALLALANGVERMCAAGLLRDCTDDYRWSNWGMAGFCFREPEMNPKPSYAMYAWLTQILDQAKYAGRVQHDSTSLHVLDFLTRGGEHVYPVWCVRGRQEVALTVVGGHPRVADSYGNTLPIEAKDGRLTVMVSDIPVYITGTTVAGIAARTPVELKATGGTVLVDFDQAGMLAVETATSRILEANWDYPRIKGNYAVDIVQEDGSRAVKVELLDDADARKLLQRYVEMKLVKPVVIREPMEALTARVKGNGGWGRLMFELVDADGRIWTACGNQYAGSCNASDNRGDSYVSFDGWRTMTIDLPGRYPAQDLTAYRSSTTEWWPENTPEWRQQLEKYEKAKAAYAKASADFPGLKAAHEQALKEYAAKQDAYAKEKAAYDKAQADYAALVKGYKKERADYDKAKATYDKAVKAGKQGLTAPVAPVEPQALTLQPPVAPGTAPAAPVAPVAPSQPRNTGVAQLAYPVKLTKIIFGAAPNMLYVADEVPVKNRVVYIDRIGAVYSDGGSRGAM